jgi:hypothetical protein
VGQGLQRLNVPLAVIALPCGDRGEDLLGHRRGEHMQHLVAVIAGVEQASCRLKDFGGVIVCQLVGHDLVKRDVQTDADRLSVGNDLVAAFTKCLNELGVIGAGCAKVGVCEILHARSDLQKRLCAGDQPQTLGPGRRNRIHAP